MAIAAHIDDSHIGTRILFQIIIRLAQQYPDEHFVFLVSKNFKQQQELPQNCSVKVIKPAIKNHLLRYYWYQYKLPNVIKKYNIRYFLSEHSSCNLKIKTPQVLFVNTLSVKANKTKQQYAARSFEQASAIYVTNLKVAKNLLAYQPSLTQKTTMLFPGLTIEPIQMEEVQKQAILQEFTNGNEYFIFDSYGTSVADKIVVLKAYSLFKRRLKSSMQLVILEKQGADPIPDFKNYKYRKEVKIITANSTEADSNLSAAAYAAIYLSHETNKAHRSIPFLKMGIPVILFDNEINHLTYGDVALYTKIFDTHLAENIMALYKDEDLRNSLIQKGLLLGSKYNWEESCRQLAETILLTSRD